MSWGMGRIARCGDISPKHGKVTVDQKELVSAHATRIVIEGRAGRARF